MDKTQETYFPPWKNAVRLSEALRADFFQNVKSYGNARKTAHSEIIHLFGLENSDFWGKMGSFEAKKFNSTIYAHIPSFCISATDFPPVTSYSKSYNFESVHLEKVTTEEIEQNIDKGVSIHKTISIYFYRLYDPIKWSHDHVRRSVDQVPGFRDFFQGSASTSARVI